MTDLRAPFPWFGGKTLAAPMIWRAFGNTPNYVEPFFGSGAALFQRPHQPKVETVNDKDGFIANFWRAVKHDPEAVATHVDWPVNEADLHARHRWLVDKGVPLLERLINDPDWFDPKIAGWWCWGACTWIGNGWCHKDERVQKQKRRPGLNNAHGHGVHSLNRCLPKVGTPGHGIHAPTIGMKLGHSKKKPLTHRNKGVHRDSHREGGVVDVLLALSERLRHVRVCCGDWKRVLGRSTLGIDTDHGMTPCGILFDPPYDHELRDKRLYREDAAGVSDEVRDWCIENGDNPALRIALCGQDGEHDMPASWSKVAWASTSSALSRSKERIWFSRYCNAALAQGDLFEGREAS